MDHDPELLFSYLHQTRELFGNRIYLDEQTDENPGHDEHDLDSFCQSVHPDKFDFQKAPWFDVSS
jgi:hypothetical protein